MWTSTKPGEDHSGEGHQDLQANRGGEHPLKASSVRRPLSGSGTRGDRAHGDFLFLCKGSEPNMQAGHSSMPPGNQGERLSVVNIVNPQVLVGLRLHVGKRQSGFESRFFGRGGHNPPNPRPSKTDSRTAL